MRDCTVGGKKFTMVVPSMAAFGCFAGCLTAWEQVDGSMVRREFPVQSAQQSQCLARNEERGPLCPVPAPLCGGAACLCITGGANSGLARLGGDNVRWPQSARGCSSRRMRADRRMRWRFVTTSSNPRPLSQVNTNLSRLPLCAWMMHPGD